MPPTLNFIFRFHRKERFTLIVGFCDRFSNAHYLIPFDFSSCLYSLFGIDLFFFYYHLCVFDVQV